MIVWTRTEEDWQEDQKMIKTELAYSNQFLDVCHWPCLTVNAKKILDLSILENGRFSGKKIIFLFTSKKAVQYTLSSDLKAYLSEAKIYGLTKTLEFFKEQNSWKGDPHPEIFSAETLFNLIIKEYKDQKDQVVFILPGGKIRAFPLEEKLTGYGFEAKNIDLYETQERSHVSEFFLCNHYIVCFSSPSAVRGWVKSVALPKDQNFFSYAAVIGQTTKQEASCYFSHIFVIEKPSLPLLFQEALRAICL